MSTKRCSFPFGPAQCNLDISVDFAFTPAGCLAFLFEQFMLTASCFLQGITVTKEIFILAGIGCHKNRGGTSVSFSPVAPKESTHSKCMRWVGLGKQVSITYTLGEALHSLRDIGGASLELTDESIPFYFELGDVFLK